MNPVFNLGHSGRAKIVIIKDCQVPEVISNLDTGWRQYGVCGGQFFRFREEQKLRFDKKKKI